MKTKLTLLIGGTAIFFNMAVADQALAQSPVAPITATQNIGTVSVFNSNSITIRSEQSEKPVRYASSATTTFMDEYGAPVPLVMLKAGVPVTVDYVRVGDRLIARRVIVLRSLTPGPAIVDKKTPVMTAAVETN